jgi:hypothetical protein
VTAWLDFPSPGTCQSLLPGGRSSPYYIVTPHYQRNSVGVRCLHLLAHWLNRLGHSAWILATTGAAGARTNPDLLTPELTPAVRAAHVAAGRAPVVVYPETVAGNPLGAPTVARYVLNFPGLLGGDKAFAPEEIVFGFAKALADAAGAPANVLHMPALDAQLFSPGPDGPRQGVCHYAGKFAQDHGGVPFRLPLGSVEIPRDPAAMSQQQIAALFRRSELFYVYESTGLGTEAGLCGCPVVVMPNPFLDKVIAVEELSWDGVAWGDSPEEIARAKATVGNVRARYQQTVAAFFPQLERFVALTQARAAEAPADAPLAFREAGCRSMSPWYELPSGGRLAASVRLRVGGVAKRFFG